MKNILYLILAVTIAPNAYALDLVSLKASDIKQQEISVPAPVAQKAEPAVKTEQTRAYTNLWMNINNNVSMKEVEAQDYMARIDVTVRKVFDSQFDVNCRVDNNYQWATVRKSGNTNYQLSGSGMFLSMDEWGGNYNISGNVTENGQTKYLNLTMYKSFDEFSFNVNSYGLNLSINKTGINGSFDTTQYSKTAVAAVVTFALAVQADKSAPAAQPSKTKTSQYVQVSGDVNLTGNGFVPQNGGYTTVNLTGSAAFSDASGKIRSNQAYITVPASMWIHPNQYVFQTVWPNVSAQFYQDGKYVGSANMSGSINVSGWPSGSFVYLNGRGRLSGSIYVNDGQ
ncbi:MAG: hypothetical protein NTX59_07170 [Elusimicrobia bacterium]|nr:hypothetical protein [Elusimicrobiota bacterium]